MAVSKKVVERIVSHIKKYQPILSDAKNRDISESDTVVIIVDMLTDILGYKKYLDITTEHAIKSTYVDLAVKVGNDIRFLIEAKAIGVTLKDNHIKQAIDYGANKGIEWVILSNGIIWQIYRIHFKQPIEKTLIYELDMLKFNARDTQMIECLGNLSREGFTQPSMTAFCQQQQIMSKFTIAAVLLTEPMIVALRKELKKLSQNVKVEDEYLSRALVNDILKREVIDSEDAEKAAYFVKKAAKAANVRAKNKIKKTEINPAATPALAGTEAEVAVSDS